MDSAEQQEALKAKRVDDIINSLDGESTSDPALSLMLSNVLSGYTDDTTYDLIEVSIAIDQQKPFQDGVSFCQVILYSTEQEVREVAFYRTLVPQYINLNTLQCCLRGLHLLDCYRDVKLEELTGAERNIIIALIKVSVNFIILDMDEAELGFYHDGNGKPAVLIDNNKLGDLIVEHHQQVDSIIKFIEDRHSADPAALREYLSDATVLQNGTL